MTHLAEGVLAGDRRALARAITLVESTRVEDQEVAAALLEEASLKARPAVLRRLVIRYY